MNRRTASYWVARGGVEAPIARRAGSSSRGRTGRARRAGPAGPGTGYSCSPLTRSGARLVTIDRDARRARGGARRRPARRRSPARSCRARAAPRDRPATRSGCRGPGARPPRRGRASSGSWPRSGPDRGPARAATNQIPSANRSATSAASWSESRVLPVPPGPGEGQEAGRPEQLARLAPAPSRGRRSSSAGSAGCSAGGRASGSAGNPSRSPSITSWQSRSGRRSFSRCSPSPRSPTPGGQLVGDEDRGRLGQEDLAAVAGRRDPRRAMDVRPDV